ncbi:serine/threonine protein kinase [Leptolyngbya sp. FACHB-261]|nr:serine/threonine protein kinase [Leptolyngbya sp. FACHB-261]
MLGKLLDGRYQVTQVLGRGGFGQTYMAQDMRRPGCPACVVKHLKPASTDSVFLQTARRLFTSEAETLERLGNHDQIPRLLAYFEEEQEFYLIQELIQGQPLGVEIKAGLCTTESQVIHLLYDVLGTLQFVHQHGVIHRDIKPANIIRRHPDQRLVLIDFGAVKQVQTQLLNSSLNNSEQISVGTIAIGTPGYMPVEQAQGMPRPNSDLYALGMIAIQALTGCKPGEFTRDPDTGELIWRHRAKISAELAGVLERLVCYHFKERYPSAAAALQALQPLVEATTQSRTAPLPPPLPPLPPQLQLTAPLLSPKQPPSTSTPVSAPSGPSSCLLLSPQQYTCLEQLLMELTGPIASSLLRLTCARATTDSELVQGLSLHLPEPKRFAFEQRAMALLQAASASQFPPSGASAPSRPSLASHAPTNSTAPPEFVQRCERELAEFIGPIATFLVQKAIKANPKTSPVELVNILAANLDSVEKAAELRRRLST